MSPLSKIQPILVLIDTWWNVNRRTKAIFSGLAKVLIDTWWNVNHGKGDAFLAANGFNRYMVECECIFDRSKNRDVTVLIDTWWNVNSRAEDIILDKDFVLIDTWWNVNSFNMQNIGARL